MAQPTHSEQMIQRCKERGMNPPQAHFMYDYHQAILGTYAALPKWEKLARAMQYAIVNQEVYVEPEDQLIGRVYHLNQKPVETYAPDADWMTKPINEVVQLFEGYDEMGDAQLFSKWAGVGHIAWLWDRILKLGVSGIRKLYSDALTNAKDEKAVEFYQGVLILLDAMTQWNDKHVMRLEAMGMTQMAQICRHVPEHPATTFHEAVQAYFMQHIIVMSENPFGGNSPGRLDYYLWPYLERDLEAGTCTLDQARALIDELFLRLDERIHTADGWGETLSLGGSHADGTSAINPLSYIMVESIMDLNITHPLVYIRLPENPPQAFVALCENYLKNGNNRAQVLGDRGIIKALMRANVPYEDAAEYVCGGCMEVSPMGMSSDYIFNGFHNIPKFVELAITGGKCLKSGRQLESVHFKGLMHYRDFESFYQDFEKELVRIFHIFFKVQDIFSEEAEVSRPSYLLSSMIDDCLAKGRNMHGGGARYHTYGSAPIGIPNAADALFAVKKAVFDEGFCTAQELIQMLEANFEGYEAVRLRLKGLPKYGEQNEEADAMARRVILSVDQAYHTYINRWGGGAVPVVLTFVWAPVVGGILGATADGNYAGKPVAHGLTPQSCAMSKGITTAMGSVLEMPMEVFGGGASTMWDFDPTWASEELLGQILMTFIEGGGQIFQGNVIEVNELLEAQKNPEEYRHLIVRVGGYSARFVTLDKAVQDDIILRYRHHY
ncbi:MAG: pyruvate formate lyase family protein [Cellulosilyticaceae bacterium]